MLSSFLLMSLTIELMECANSSAGFSRCCSFPKNILQLCSAITSPLSFTTGEPDAPWPVCESTKNPFAFQVCPTSHNCGCKQLLFPFLHNTHENSIVLFCPQPIYGYSLKSLMYEAHSPTCITSIRLLDDQ